MVQRQGVELTVMVQRQSSTIERLFVGFLMCFLIGFLMCIFGFLSVTINLKKLHNMGSDRIGLLEKISYKVNFGDQTGTAFAASYKGHHFGVTAAHFATNRSIPNGVVACNRLDVSILVKDCPTPSFSIDATKFIEPLVGDDAFVYGFPTDSRFRSYRATIGETLQWTSIGAHFNSELIVRNNSRYLVGADQVDGFSGGCVLNGHGIIGMVCCKVGNTTNAVMIPWSDIFQCIEDSYYSGVIFPANCTATMIAPPTLLSSAEKLVLGNEYGRIVTQWLYQNF
jgi:hypothetical protein